MGLECALPGPFSLGAPRAEASEPNRRFEKRSETCSAGPLALYFFFAWGGEPLRFMPENSSEASAELFAVSEAMSFKDAPISCKKPGPKEDEKFICPLWVEGPLEGAPGWGLGCWGGEEEEEGPGWLGAGLWKDAWGDPLTKIAGLPKRA